MKKQFVFSPGLEPGLDVYKTSSLTISRREGENSVFHNRLFLTNTMKKHKFNLTSGLDGIRTHTSPNFKDIQLTINYSKTFTF